MWYGDLNADFGAYENLADESTKLFAVNHIWMDELNGLGPAPRDVPGFFAHIPRIDGVNDGLMISGDVGTYAPNPWGLGTESPRTLLPFRCCLSGCSQRSRRHTGPSMAQRNSTVEVDQGAWDLHR